MGLDASAFTTAGAVAAEVDFTNSAVAEAVIAPLAEVLDGGDVYA